MARPSLKRRCVAGAFRSRRHATPPGITPPPWGDETMPTTSERLVENLCYARALYRHWRRQGRLKDQDFAHLMSHLKALADTLDPAAQGELNVGAIRELDEFSPGREELEFARLQFVQVQNQAGISSAAANSCLHDWHARCEAIAAEGDVLPSR